MKMKTNYTDWVVIRSQNLLHSVASKKITEATTNFLINGKLVKKDFSSLDFTGGNYDQKSSVTRLFRIILANIRKHLPILKSGDAIYFVPFIQIIGRDNYIDFILKDSALRSINKYISRYKLRETLEEAGVSMSITVLASSTYINNEYSPTTIVRLSSNITNVGDNRHTSMHYFIFLLPDILKIMLTLHRKALFRNGTSPTV